jgi:hypothetical protein
VTLEKLRICPLPQQWDELWKLIGAPNELMPLILSGWAFSTDRQKRERFQAQVEYAQKIGFGEEIQLFLSKLRHDQWHYCWEDHLDFDYSEVIHEDYQHMLAQEKAEQKAIETARALYSELRSFNDGAAYAPNNLGDFLDRWYARFCCHSFDINARIAEIEASLSLDEQTEWSIPASDAVEAELEACKLKLKTELLLLKLEQTRTQYFNADGSDFWRDVFGESDDR